MRILEKCPRPRWYILPIQKYHLDVYPMSSTEPEPLQTLFLIRPLQRGKVNMTLILIWQGDGGSEKLKVTQHS